MKLYHGTYAKTRIEKFDFTMVGKNTKIEGLSNMWYHATTWLGIWFSENTVDRPYNYEYDVEDKDMMVVENLDELISWLRNEVMAIENTSDNELYMNEETFKTLVLEVRNKMIEEGFSGIWINYDYECDCSTAIVINNDIINYEN